jgi:hypothetical protein
MNKRCPARKRLRHRSVQVELVAPGQDEMAGAALFVDKRLDIRQNARDTLYFIDNRSFGETLEESARIAAGEFSLVMIAGGR